MWPTHYIPIQDRIDGVPPPRIYLTSCPYPYEMSEAFASSGEFTSATPGEETTEAFATVGAFVSGILVAYGYDVLEVVQEDLESAGAFVSGILNDCLRTITAPVEALEAPI